jgi:hypothetical protein
MNLKGESLPVATVFMKKMLLLPALLALGIAGAQTLPDTIPFTLNKQSNICIRASINQADSLVLMFHSSATGVTLTREAVGKKLPLAAQKSTEVKTWGGSAEAQYSEGNTLTIKNLKWDSLTVFINENAGVGTDGKFGFDLFEGKIVAIDYDEMRMIVHAALPKMPKGFFKTKLLVRAGSTFIPGALKIGKTVYRDTFMFHTGYGGAILLDPKIGERYAMQATLPTISTSELQDAYGNVFKIETKSLPQIQVGGQKLKNVPLSFAARSSDIPMKVFGNGLLKRFNVVFDFQKNEVYLKPNGFWAAAF